MAAKVVVNTWIDCAARSRIKLSLSLSRLGCGKFNSAYTISLIRFIRGIAVALNDVRAEGNA